MAHWPGQTNRSGAVALIPLVITEQTKVLDARDASTRGRLERSIQQLLLAHNFTSHKSCWLPPTDTPGYFHSSIYPPPHACFLLTATQFSEA